MSCKGICLCEIFVRVGIYVLGFAPEGFSLEAINLEEICFLGSNVPKPQWEGEQTCRTLLIFSGGVSPLGVDKACITPPIIGISVPSSSLRYMGEVPSSNHPHT